MRASGLVASRSRSLLFRERVSVWERERLVLMLSFGGREGRTCMEEAMLTLDPLRAAAAATLLELAGLATTAFLEDITIEFMFLVVGVGVC